MCLCVFQNLLLSGRGHTLSLRPGLSGECASAASVRSEPRVVVVVVVGGFFLVFFPSVFLSKRPFLPPDCAVLERSGLGWQQLATD